MVWITGVSILRNNYARHLHARFLERDGYPSDPENIFLTDGASPAVQRVLNLLIKTPNTGVWHVAVSEVVPTLWS